MTLVALGLMYLERYTWHIMYWASGIRKLTLTYNKTYVLDIHLAEVL